MVLVEKVRGGRVNVRGMGHYEVGDQDDLSPSDAEYLVEERGDFEYVDGPPAGPEPEAGDDGDGSQEDESGSSGDSGDDSADGSDGDDADSDGASEPEEDGAAEDPADEGDGNSEEEGFDENGWLENDYRDRADAVSEGGLDEFLDEIEEVETSDTVIDAVQDRRDELEG